MPDRATGPELVTANPLLPCIPEIIAINILSIVINTHAMKNQNLELRLNQAKKIARELHNLLHEDAVHRLTLYQTYSYDQNTTKWSPNLYQRCQLVEALRRKLEDPE